MTNQVSKQTRQATLAPVFVFQPPVQADYPLLKAEQESIARQTSVARGWIAALRGEVRS